MFATQIEACNRVDVRSGDRVEDVRQPFVRMGSGGREHERDDRLTADAGASLLERVASDLVTGLNIMFATQIEACNRVDVRSGDRVEDVRQPFVRLGSVAHAGFLLHDSARTEDKK
jgi:hypothetical protein